MKDGGWYGIRKSQLQILHQTQKHVTSTPSRTKTENYNMSNENLIYEAVARVAVANRSALTTKPLELGADNVKIDLTELAVELCHAFNAIDRSSACTEMSDLAYRAMEFAREKHKNQRRKYTDEPYFLHLAEVAGITYTTAVDVESADTMVAIAWLHDTIDDCGVAREELEALFGTAIAWGVWHLSDTEEGNRAERKAKARERIAGAARWVQNIKVADLISNTSSILRHDPKFAVIYLDEARQLLDVLTRADPRLLAMAREQIGA